MADSKLLKYYIIFFVIFTTFTSGYFAESTKVDFKNYLPISSLIGKMNNDIVSNVLKIVLVPFIVLDFIILIIGFLSLTFINLPAFINVIILAPFGIIITIDYIIPMIRGN